MVSTNTVCFEGVQRIYRNAVVKHMREKLVEHYPDRWRDELKSPFLKEWDKIAADAEIRRKTGELTSPLADDFDLLGVNHFLNLFDKFFPVLFPDTKHMAEDVAKQTKQGILGWSKTVKNLRDPALGHPADDDIDFYDAIGMLDAARRILETINPDEADRLRNLCDGVAGGER